MVYHRLASWVPHFHLDLHRQEHLKEAKLPPQAGGIHLSTPLHLTHLARSLGVPSQ